MTIVGFNYNIINFERKKPHKGSVNINNNITIKNIEKADLSLKDNNQQGLKFQFEFVSKYTPELASLLIQGEVVSVAEDKIAKTVLTKWKKDKKVDPELIAPILNTALTKCNIKALQLSEDFNLPPPVPLPRVNLQKTKTTTEQKNYIG